MTDARAATLVLKNEAGDYFLIPQDVVERGRVPAEHRAELEQAIAAAQGSADGDDVQGHILQETLEGSMFYKAGASLYWLFNDRATLGPRLHR